MPRPDGWRVEWRYPDDCDDCGESCKRSTAPGRRGRLRRRRLLRPLRRARRRPRVRDAPGSPVPRRARNPVRALRRTSTLDRTALATTSLALSLARSCASRALRLRAFDRPLPRFRPGPREPLARRRAAPRRRRPGGADHRGAGRRRRRAARRGRSSRSCASCSAPSSTSTRSTRSPRASRRSRRSSPSSAACARRSRSSRSRRLVTSITAQQVSLLAAFAIRNRLIERFGVRAEHAYAFPTRERLALAEPDELTALGFSRRKAEYVVGLARSDLDLDALALLPTRRSRQR